MNLIVAIYGTIKLVRLHLLVDENSLQPIVTVAVIVTSCVSPLTFNEHFNEVRRPKIEVGDLKLIIITICLL